MNSVFDAVADGLAEHSYAIADQFLSQNEVDSILALDDFKEAIERFKKAGIGQQQSLRINEGIRGDYIQWLDKNKAPLVLSPYFQRVEQLMQYLNETLFLSLKDYEVHMTVYPVGSFYKRHLDQFKKNDHRKLSIICYLNNDWKEEHGGQLRIFQPEALRDILPIAGRLVCFRSDMLEHEVLPATRERLSLTGWLLDQLADMRHLS
jgi:SM-20-related protein